MENSRNFKKIFVTVGTTLFDELIGAVLQPEVLEILEQDGYTDLILQVGKGAEPVMPNSSSLRISWFRFKESIQNDIENASLVISHAGAGSCTEILRAGKPLVVVVNATLMNNHQTELAERLSGDGHVLMCHPQSLLTTLKEVGGSQFLPFPKPKTHNFSNFLEKLMGFS